MDNQRPRQEGDVASEEPLSDRKLKALVEKGIITAEDRKNIEAALDFYLVAKDIIRETNILNPDNLTKLSKMLDTAEGKIKLLYEQHTKHISDAVEKIRQFTLKKYSQEDWPEVRGVVSCNEEELKRLISTHQTWEIWSAIALRKDVSADLHRYLVTKLKQRQNVYGEDFWQVLENFMKDPVTKEVTCLKQHIIDTAIGVAA